MVIIMLNFNKLEIKEAKRFKDRLLGLMFKKNISYGLLFKHCKSIHTFFMLEEIDVIATDNDDNILKRYKNIKPWRILIAPKGTITKRYYKLVPFILLSPLRNIFLYHL